MESLFLWGDLMKKKIIIDKTTRYIILAGDITDDDALEMGNKIIASEMIDEIKGEMVAASVKIENDNNSYRNDLN